MNENTATWLALTIIGWALLIASVTVLGGLAAVILNLAALAVILKSFKYVDRPTWWPRRKES